MFSFRALAFGHIVIGVLLLPIALLSGGILGPLMAGPIWGIVLGVRLWQRGTEMFTILRRTHWAFLLIDVLLAACGIFALRAAERSAARGGGLLGGIGAVQVDERGDSRTVVVATPDMTSDYAVVHTLAERKASRRSTGSRSSRFPTA